MLPFEGNNGRRIKWEISKDFTNKKSNVVANIMTFQSFISLSPFFWDTFSFKYNRIISVYG